MMDTRPSLSFAPASAPVGAATTPEVGSGLLSESGQNGRSIAVLNFPYPPSVNSIWKRRKRGSKPYLSEGYQAWKREFDGVVMATVPRPKILGPFVATITLSSAKRKSNSDADNRVKVVLDALQRCGIIENDSLADSVTVRWGVAPEGASVTVIPALVPGDNSIVHPPKELA